VNEEIRFNHPQWLIDRLREAWPDDWQRVLESNQARAPMWLRVNRRRLDIHAYLEQIAGAGTLLPGFDQAIRLNEPRPVTDLPGFADGLVSVQDAAAQIAAPWLLEAGGERLLDACAAPGGKSGHLLELSAPGAVLTAVDLNPDRLALAGENLARLGLSARLVAADAGRPVAWWDGQPFDRILLDAPCSATGVIRRHPDIPLLRRNADIDALATRQQQLLSALWELLAPGGRLLYVTCSVLPEENEAQVGQLLRQQCDAEESSVLPNYNIRDVMRRRAVGYQILTGDLGLDGFYYACLEKRA
jgi:16S rRNA (cytosine967-C5)-methyltransferase